MLTALKPRFSTAWQVLKRAYARWAEVDGGQRSAANAFYLLLSLLPFIILLVSAGSLFVEREVATHEVVQLINQYTPLTREQESDAVAQIRGLLDARGRVSLMAFPLLIWGALRFLRALIRTTNRIWRSPTYEWWKLPLKSLGLLGITVSAVLGGIFIPVVAQLVQQWLAPHLEMPAWAFGLFFRVMPWLVLFYGLSLIYKLAPSRPTRFADVWFGALVATLAIWLVTTLFVVQAVSFGHYNALYGALGGIVAFLLWIYISSGACVFGVCLCAGLMEAREESTGQTAVGEHRIPGGRSEA